MYLSCVDEWATQMWNERKIAQNTHHSKYICTVKKRIEAFSPWCNLLIYYLWNTSEWSNTRLIVSITCNGYWNFFGCFTWTEIVASCENNKGLVRQNEFHLGFCYDSLHSIQPTSFIHLSSNTFSNCYNTQPEKKIRYPIGEKCQRKALTEIWNLLKFLSPFNFCRIKV